MKFGYVITTSGQLIFHIFGIDVWYLTAPTFRSRACCLCIFLRRLMSLERSVSLMLARLAGSGSSMPSLR